MKKENLSQVNGTASVSDFKKKKQKYSYTAATSTALILAAILILNAIVSVLGNKINLKLDMTKDNILSFSDTTNEVIGNLKTGVNIISLIPQSDTNREMIQIDEVLKKYDMASDKITYKRVDAKKNPAVLNKYPLDGKPLDGDYYVIFESERMHHVVSVDDLLIVYANANHSDIFLSGALKAEQYFSSAIVKITEGSEINAYVSKGHGEKFTAENFAKDVFPGAGYSFKDISLSGDDIPQDADVLIIASPETDYSNDEISKIDAFSRRGGDIQIISDTDSGELANLYGYMDEWGLSFTQGIAADEDAGNYSSDKLSLIAKINKNDITDSMGVEGQAVLFPLTRPIEFKEKVNISHEVLATTGKNGYVKHNVYSTNDSFEDGDIKKQSNLSVVATRQYSIEDVSHMSVLGTSYFIGIPQTGNYSILNSTANRKFLTGLMNYMTDQPSNFYIMPKNIVQDEVVINQMSIYLYTMVTVVFIPLFIIAFGIIIWLRRRSS